MLKYGAQKFLSLIPFRLGWRFNHWLRRRVGGLKSQPVYSFSSVLIMAWLLERAGFTVSGKKLVELGTGWDSCGALTALALGADQIDTFDQERRLDDALATIAKNLIADPHSFYKQDN